MSILDKIYNKADSYVVHHRGVWKMVEPFLRSSLLLRNPVYLSLYRRDMEHKMRDFEIFPSTLALEATNRCNVSCVFCPHDKMRRPQGVMSDSLFIKVIDEGAALGVQTVSLGVFGDPLLDKNLPEKVRYAKSVGIKRVFVVSNGLSLTADVARRLIEAQLDLISISVYAASAEMYARVHRVKKELYAIVDQNIKFLMTLREQMGAKKPIVGINTHEFEMVRNECKDICRKYKKMADYVAVGGKLENWGGSIDLGTPGWGMRIPCGQLWRNLCVLWDGRVGLCCFDYEGEDPLGDVNTNSLIDVWHGKKRREIWEFHRKGQFEKVSLCRECTVNYLSTHPWW